MKNFIIIILIALLNIKIVYSQTSLDYLYSGDAKLESNNYTEAINEYNKAIEILIKDNESLKSLLDTLETWSPEQTAEKMQNVILLEWAYYNCGLAFINLGQFQKAYTNFTKIIELGTTDYRVYFQRGLASFNLLNFQKSILDFTKSIEIDSTIPESYLNRGLAKFNLQDYRGAVLDFSELINLNSEFAPGYFYRGFAKSNLEDYRGSILDFSKAIEYNPNYADAYYQRGLSKYFLNQIEDCCLDLSKAGELGHEKAYEAIKNICN